MSRAKTAERYDPRIKAEQALRGAVIADIVDAEVNNVVKDFRRRMFNLKAELVAEYNEECDSGSIIPPIDDARVMSVRKRTHEWMKDIAGEVR